MSLIAYKNTLINIRKVVLLALTLCLLLLPAHSAQAIIRTTGGGASTTTNCNPTSQALCPYCSTATTTTGCIPPDTDSAASCNSSDGGQCDLIDTYVNPIIEVLGAIFGVIAVISIILGGIQFSASSGDPQKAAAAKQRIINTVIAIVAFLFLYAFLQFLIPGGIFNRS